MAGSNGRKAIKKDGKDHGKGKKKRNKKGKVDNKEGKME